MTKKKITPKVEEKGLSAYTQVWVIGTDVDRVYIDKKEAEDEADKMNKSYYEYYRKLQKNMTDEQFTEYFKNLVPFKKVMSLKDAIDLIKEEVRDEYNSLDEDY